MPEVRKSAYIVNELLQVFPVDKVELTMTTAEEEIRFAAGAVTPLNVVDGFVGNRDVASSPESMA